MTQDQKKLADSFFWWHKIKLSDDYTTPGICGHTAEDAIHRFGLPEDMSGLSVLDVGAWDGLFSFEAEKRGARTVRALDVYQRVKGQNLLQFHKANAPFKLAKNILNSKVDFSYSSLENWEETPLYDYIFHFGIMYHIQDPLNHVSLLMDMIAINGTILLETAISNFSGAPILEYKPNFEDDPTNCYYPNIEWVDKAFKEHGAKSVECFYNDGVRATFRIKA